MASPFKVKMTCRDTLLWTEIVVKNFLNSPLLAMQYKSTPVERLNTAIVSSVGDNAVEPLFTSVNDQHSSNIEHAHELFCMGRRNLPEHLGCRSIQAPFNARQLVGGGTRLLPTLFHGRDMTRSTSCPVGKTER